MAIRVRKDGTMWCAAHTEPQDGDTYIDDALHYEMSVVHGVIASLPMPAHEDHPEWWWSAAAPIEAIAIRNGYCLDDNLPERS